MNAGQTAVTVSLIIYTFGYVVSLYAVSFWFSTGLMPEKLRALSTTPVVFKTVLLTTFFVPLLAFLSFYWSIGAPLPDGKQLSDYANYFSTGAHITWFLILKPMVIGLLVGLITPETMGFSHRNKAILAFVMHNVGSYSMIQLMKWVIEIALS